MKDFLDVFRNLISDEVLVKMEYDFDSIADTNILELGLDSLAIMEIVIRIEEIYKVEIDYDMFEIEYIETPRKIQHYISTLRSEQV